MTESELLQRWVAAADDVALAFAHEPDDRVAASLEQMRQKIIDNFLRVFPNADRETMTAGADCIVAEIQKRRRAIGNRRDAAGSELRSQFRGRKKLCANFSCLDRTGGDGVRSASLCGTRFQIHLAVVAGTCVT
jgi:hypothetical protein